MTYAATGNKNIHFDGKRLRGGSDCLPKNIYIYKKERLHLEHVFGKDGCAGAEWMTLMLTRKPYLRRIVQTKARSKLEHGPSDFAMTESICACLSAGLICIDDGKTIKNEA